MTPPRLPSVLRAVRDARVLVTGHTGFKGSWLTEWLLGHGARVYGLALPPAAGPSLHHLLHHADRIRQRLGDIRHATTVQAVVREAQPEWVFHLAAQPLVRQGYRDPHGTWATNLGGTLHLLQALHEVAVPRAVVMVTTDKVYKHRPPPHAYRETDELGGEDPYAASKAACELAVASWRLAYSDGLGSCLATARAGNVLGAGDWSADRIVPDCYRAWQQGTPVTLRYPDAVRPWQHVLDALAGYLTLSHALAFEPDPPRTVNFGPVAAEALTVRELVDALGTDGRGPGWITGSPVSQVPEAAFLSLATDLARERLDWSPRLSTPETIAWTRVGYTHDGPHMARTVEQQLADFESRCNVGAS